MPKKVIILLFIIAIVVNLNLLIGPPATLIDADSGFYLESASKITVNAIINKEIHFVGYHLFYLFMALLLKLSFNNIYIFKFYEILLIFISSLIFYKISYSILLYNESKRVNVNKNNKLKSVKALMVSVAYISLLSYSGWLEGGNLREEYALLPYICSLYFLFGYYYDFVKINWKNSMIFGIMLGVTPLFKEPFALIVLPAVLFTFYFFIKKKNKANLLFFFMGLILPILIMMGLSLFLNGEFMSMFNLTHKIAYTQQYGGGSSVLRIVKNIRNLFFRIVLTPFGVIFLSFFLNNIYLSLKKKISGAIVLFNTTCFLLSILFFVMIQVFQPHYLMQFIPMFIIALLFSILSCNDNEFKLHTSIIIVILFSITIYNIQTVADNQNRLGSNNIELHKIQDAIDSSGYIVNNLFVNFSGPFSYNFLLSKPSLDNYNYFNSQYSDENDFKINLIIEEIKEKKPDFIYYNKDLKFKYGYLIFEEIGHLYNKTSVNNLYRYNRFQ